MQLRSEPKTRKAAPPCAAHTTALEERIDRLHSQLPELRNFILPSGGKAAAFLHVARATRAGNHTTLWS